MCSYFSILILIPILCARQNRFAMYHANQGLLLLLTSAVVYIVGLLPIVGFVGTILSVVVFILMVLGVVNAASGRVRPLPMIGGITLLRL